MEKKDQTRLREGQLWGPLPPRGRMGRNHARVVITRSWKGYRNTRYIQG